MGLQLRRPGPVSRDPPRPSALRGPSRPRHRRMMDWGTGGSRPRSEEVGSGPDPTVPEPHPGGATEEEGRPRGPARWARQSARSVCHQALSDSKRGRGATLAPRRPAPEDARPLRGPRSPAPRPPPAPTRGASGTGGAGRGGAGFWAQGGPPAVAGRDGQRPFRTRRQSSSLPETSPSWLVGVFKYFMIRPLREFYPARKTKNIDILL